VAAIGLALVVLPLRTNVVALLKDDPFSPGRETARTTVEELTGTTTTVMETPGDAALVEQVLGRGGLVLVRLAVVAGAAFLAGAVTQRVPLASFSIKVAGVEIPALPEVAKPSGKGLEQVRSQIDGLWKAVEYVASAGAGLAERVDMLEFPTDHPPGGGEHPPTPPSAGG